jgi:glyoxylase-like metal-dependent hydrolase (beta-lactamase superfamily II)
LRRFLKIFGAVFLALVLMVVGVGVASFAGMPPVIDGVEVGGVGRLVKDGYVAAYVLDIGGGKVALVDAGNDAAATALLAELTRRGLDASAVTDILLTHGHPDHIAGVNRFPNAVVHALGAEVPLVERRVGARGPVTRWFGPLDTGVRVSDPLMDGARVPIGTRVAEVYAVPGHTTGSAVWLVDGVLFFGDSADATTRGGMVGAKWIFTDDAGQNHTSLRALAARLAPRRSEVRALAFAHSGVLDSGDALFRFE